MAGAEDMRMKLAKLGALFARGATAGERAAADLFRRNGGSSADAMKADGDDATPDLRAIRR
ncbi:hypothetical protein ACN9JG_17385 (plasmid) [Cereibacter azotoformans]|uniref:hypothetical protein n=1 Tax=Cereibacter azotoformans TaxID=43057 RepID=UPI003B21AA13